MKKINIEIINQTDKRSLTKKRIKNVVYAALIAEGIPNANITIILMDNADITKINSQFLNHNYPTDVISFALDTEPLEGEIYIGIEIAELQSKDYDVPLNVELMRLAVHGTLHCIGYDDATPELRAEMAKLEDLYINSEKQYV